MAVREDVDARIFEFFFQDLERVGFVAYVNTTISHSFSQSVSQSAAVVWPVGVFEIDSRLL